MKSDGSLHEVAKGDLRNDVKNVPEDEVVPEDGRCRWLLSVWESTSNGRGFFFLESGSP